MQDCQNYGISALAGCQVNTKQPWVIPLSQSRYTWLLTLDPSERLGARHEQSPKTSDLQRGIPRRLSGALYALSWYMQLLNSHEQVRKTLMKSRLSPPGQRPIVCIDEAQVRVFLLSSSIIWSFNLGLRPSSWMGRLQDWLQILNLGLVGCCDKSKVKSLLWKSYTNHSQAYST